MQNLISQTFAVTAQKPTVSVDHIDNYYITEASGIMPSVNDSRWRLIPDGQQVPVPTPSAPYLWHKYITYLTDGTALDPIVEFAGSLGQNGFDYDLVPSNSAIIKDTSDNLTPANVTCSLIKRNADGSAETQSTVPSGYSVVVYRDNTPSPYTLGANVPTSGITSVITFVLKYDSIEVERHDIRVIAEGAEGLTGRGIQSQDTRFKATATNSQPATPTNDTTWNTWSALSSAGYSQDTPYLWKCIRTVYRNGNGTTDTEYLVEGPTVWGQNGADAIFIDLDNEMDAIPCDSTGKVTSRTVLTSYARLYRGSAIINTDLTAPVAANCKLGSVTPTVTSQTDGSYKLEWVFAVNTLLSVDRLTANVAIGYGGKSYAALFTANVVKSGSPGVSPAIYQLLLSQNEASFARNSSNQLTPAYISIRCGYTKNYNGTIDKHVGSQASDLQNIDSKYNIFYRPIASNGNPGSWAWMKDLSSANFYLVIPNSTTNIAYEFVLSTASGTASIEESNIFDRETLPINKDGLNGAPGESALIIDLTNENDAFGTKADGKITASVSRETRASMFYGITPLTATYQSTKTYEDGTNCGNEVDVVIDSETGLVTVTMNNTNFVYNKTIFIDITGTASGYTDKPKTARFTIQPQAAGSDGKTPIIYQLMPSPSQLSFARNSDGTLNMANNVITGYVKKIEDEDTTILSSLSGYRIYYGYGNPTTPSNYISVGGTITVSASNAASYASLVLELWKMNGTTKQKRLDRETIPINKEGQKGNPGDPGDDGITPFIIDIDNEMTSVPVSQEGAVIAATTLEFNLAAYYGQTNVINDCTVACISGSDQQVTVDVTTNKAKPKIVIAQGFTPPTMIELCFRVTHANYGSRDAIFSIAFVKAGGQGLNAILYELLPSLSQIAVGRTDNGAYNPANVALTCGYTKTDGPNTTSVADCTSSFDGYEIYFRRFSRSSNAWQTTYYKYRTYKSYLASIVVATYSKVQFIICTNTSGTITNTNLDDVNVTGLIDRETVPIVADGQKGGQGESSLIIDLDNEMDAFGTASNGKISASVSRQTTAKMFYGTTLLTSTLAYTKKYEDGNACGSEVDVTVNSETGLVTVTMNNTNFVYNKTIFIDITGTASGYTDKPKTARFTIQPQAAGSDGKVLIYQLLPSKKEIAFSRDDSNQFTPQQIGVYCGYTKNDNGSISSYDGSQQSHLMNIGSKYNIFYRFTYTNGTTSQWYWMKDLTSTSYELRIGYNGLVAQVEFVLSSASGYASVGSANIIDRETVPVLYAGANGGTGPTGPEGNGISVDDFYYCLTATLAPPQTTTLTTANGWYKRGTTGCPTAPTAAYPFLWECEDLQYSKTTSMNKKVLRLFQVYNMSIQPNLLEQSAFDAEDVMTAWTSKLGEVIPQARGAYNAFGSFPASATVYKDILQQIVLKAGEINKIKSNTYYTFSFYSRTRRMVNLTSNRYGFGTTEIYLHEGVYKLQINGHCSTVARAAETPVALRGYLYGPKNSNTGWDKSTMAEITTTTDDTKTSGTLTVTAAGVYQISFYAYKSQNQAGGTNETVTINWWRLLSTSDNSLIRTYLYPQGPASNSTYFVDGEVKSNPAADGAVAWALDLDDAKADSGGWTRHSVTFLTRDLTQYLNNGVPYQRQVLFRIYNTYVEICQPKLEESVIATDWCEHEDDSDLHCSHNPRGQWVSGTAYFYCKGIRDVVSARTSASSSALTFWRMKRRTTSTGYSSTTQPYLDTEHWERADFLKFLATEVFFANEAFINNLLLNYAKARNTNTNEVTVSIDGTTGDINAKGTIKVKALYTVEGGYTTVNGKKMVDLGTNIGNSYVIPANAKVYLPDPSNYEGLTLTFIFQTGGVLGYDSNDGIYMAYYTGDSYSGVIPSGMSPRAFHSLDGLETVTIMAIKAYGSDAVKWTLTGQRGILGVRSTVNGSDEYKITPEGKLLINEAKTSLKFNLLAAGFVTGTSSGATLHYTTCLAGFSLTVSRVETGIYKLKFPNGYFSDVANCHVMVTGRGCIYNGTNPIKANVHDFGDNTNDQYVRISTSDDETRNDGSFNFLIYKVSQ